MVQKVIRSALLIIGDTLHKPGPTFPGHHLRHRRHRHILHRHSRQTNYNLGLVSNSHSASFPYRDLVVEDVGPLSDAFCDTLGDVGPACQISTRTAAWAGISSVYEEIARSVRSQVRYHNIIRRIIEIFQESESEFQTFLECIYHVQ